ncbi:DUF1993 domain-containing protein [Telluria aromaticivorans]|uniref:DUF1993 domain-containing protein n=1 Tax=Telluria aromaticivorans TaxID=2725995 RepID=A0A7Y2JUY7_9BURK|nr:DUF1993 domain-containing protein [Telluria aromaticivorans]NNG21466.1 DUF1993 domain-containing protein [Telluria aromaticivorans]
MSITIYKVSVPAFVRGLNVLSTLLTKAEEHSVQAGVAPDSLLDARLVEDMLPLSAQVQRVSDACKFAAQRISGGDAPTFNDNESTFEQLQLRIKRTIDYLESVDAELLNAGGDREVNLNWGPRFSGESYLLTFALPNFYFHLVTAYDILRHKGVKLGKLDYLGPLDVK